MNELQIISGEFDGGKGKAILATQLYEFLELNNSNYSKWFKNSIEDNDFLIEGEDYINVPQYEGSKKDCILTIAVAKKIAMRSNSPKGEEVRDYFIKVEKEFKERQRIEIPKTYIAALRKLADSEEEKTLLENRVQEDRPKVEFYDSIQCATNAISVGDYAKVLDKISKIGRNRLFVWLREQEYLMKGNLPYQKYVDMGLFSVIESTHLDSQGNSRVVTQTLITGKGQIRIEQEYRSEFSDGTLNI